MSCNEETKISAVIFDLDGTLLDTESATRGVLNGFLATYGKELDKEKEEKKRVGMTQQESVAVILKDYQLPLTPEQFITEITPLYRERWTEAKALPGANRLINHLKKNGVPMALASNSLRENIDVKISHHNGWKESFSVILGSDQVKSGKPSPYLFEEAAKKMGVDASNCLVIEDSLVGVKAANAAKMKVVAIPSRGEVDCYLLADSVLHSLLEFQPELWGLPPFDDYNNTLPIEPILVSGVYVDGALHECTGFSFGAAMSCCREFKGCNEVTKISAVIFDLDGTLLDNGSASRGVLNDFLAKYGKELDKEKEEKRRVGMTLQEAVAVILKDYELPLTPEQYITEITPLYRERWSEGKALPGANRLINHLKKNGVPIALASNSPRENIDVKISYHDGWKESFSVIIGSDQVKSGKPSPYLFEEAAKKMGVDASNCLVIEDSLVGVKAANAAKMKVVAVPSRAEADCYLLADTVLHSLLEFQPELWGLPPFDDWIDNTLPIEPVLVSGVYVNGALHESTENGTVPLPGQVFGLYFGWAKVHPDMNFKVLVSIHLDHLSHVANKRIINICLIDPNSDHMYEQQRMQIHLVGYIRAFDNKEVTSKELEKLEEYKSIARASLDLPSFTYSFIKGNCKV